MKKLIRSFTLTLALFTAAQSFADTPIDRDTQVINTTVRYANTIFPIDRGGGIYPMALIGGNVQFEGVGPVYVTLYIGGQSYTALTDSRGEFSFFAFANGTNRYEVRAWVSNSESGPGAKHSGVLGSPAVLK